MVKLPPRDDTVNRIYEKYLEAQRSSPPRPHLGASEIGRECERAIWYGFRWSKPNTFSGQMLRLFETGKLAENRLIADLRSIDVHAEAFDLTTGRQYRFELFGGHFGGSVDGICQGLVEAPKTPHILEMKTHNDKSFKSLYEKGVQTAKPEHYIQMQSYMGMSHDAPLEKYDPFTRALYFAVNKNTDQLYIERVKYDPIEYIRIKERAKRIIFSDRPPPRISNKSDFYQCRFCNFNGLCHGKPEHFEKPVRNCRTCIHATPFDDGTWRCEKWGKPISVEEQVRGCEKHLFLPYFFPLKQIDATDDSVIYHGDESEEIVNYEGGEIVRINKRPC